MWEFAQDSVTEQLKVDQALLNVTSTLFETVWLYQLSDECVAVKLKHIEIQKKKIIRNVILSTHYIFLFFYYLYLFSVLIKNLGRFRLKVMWSNESIRRRSSNGHYINQMLAHSLLKTSKFFN